MSKSTEETSSNGCKVPGCTFKLKVSRGKPYLTNGYCNTHVIATLNNQTKEGRKE